MKSMERIDWNNTDEVRTKVSEYRNRAKDFRSKKLDPDWFVWQSFVRGHHFVKWDGDTKKVQYTGNSDIKVTVNKVYQTLRAVRNYVTRNDPKWQAVGVNRTPESAQSSDASNKFLEYIYRVEGVRRKFKEVVQSALVHSVGFVQVLWDEDKYRNGFEGDVSIEVIDPFDLYIDPSASQLQTAKYIIKAVRRNIEDLKNNDVYDQESVERVIADKDLASSPWKSRLMQQTFGGMAQGEDDTVIVYECWVCDYKDGKKSIRIVTLAGDGDEVIRNEETEYDHYPFFMYSADVNTLEIYGEGWVKNLIPLNKVYNALMTLVVEHLVNFKGKILAPMGAGLKRVTNASGEIITYKRGFEPQVWQPTGLPAAPFNALELVETAFEDIGAVHDATMGRIPSGAKSGKALEALQAGDANNLSDLVQNFEDFASQVGMEVLAIAGEKYQEARIIDIIGPDGQAEELAVIGAGATNKPQRLEGMGLDVFQVGGVNEVVVTMSSFLANTQEARTERVLDLLDRQVMTVEEVRQEFKLSPTPEGNIVREIKEQPAPMGGAQMGELDEMEQMLNQAQTPEELAQIEQLAQEAGV